MFPKFKQTSSPNLTYVGRYSKIAFPINNKGELRMQKELEKIAKKIDYIYRDTKDYIESCNKGLSDIFGHDSLENGFEDIVSTLNPYDLEFYVRNEVSQKLKNRALRIIDGNLGSNRETTINEHEPFDIITLPEGLVTVLVGAQYLGSVTPLDYEKGAYYYNIEIIVTYEGQTSNGFKVATGGFSLILNGTRFY